MSLPISGELLRGPRPGPAVGRLPEGAVLVAARLHRLLLPPLPLHAGRVRHVHRTGHHSHWQTQGPGEPPLQGGAAMAPVRWTDFGILGLSLSTRLGAMAMMADGHLAELGSVAGQDCEVEHQIQPRR